MQKDIFIHLLFKQSICSFFFLHGVKSQNNVFMYGIYFGIEKKIFELIRLSLNCIKG